MTRPCHAKPSFVYQLVEDPDRENGLLVRGRQLRLNYAEIESGLQLAVFTPGSVIRHLRQGKQYQVAQIGGHQYLELIS